MYQALYLTANPLFLQRLTERQQAFLLTISVFSIP